MSFKITGLDKLQWDLADTQKAMKNLDGELGRVSFKVNDPGSIEAALQEMERMVDERLGSYVSNPIVRPMIAGMKEKYRQAIVEQAAKSRLEGDR